MRNINLSPYNYSGKNIMSSPKQPVRDNCKLGETHQIKRIVKLDDLQ